MRKRKRLKHYGRESENIIINCWKCPGGGQGCRGAGGQGAGVLTKVLYREAYPQGIAPYVLHTIFDKKGTSFGYLLLKNGTPFTNLVFIFVPL